MKKFLGFLLFCGLAAGCFYMGTLAADRQVLSDRWVRIHVVAASDSEEDQNMKLRVRNGLLARLERQLEGMEEARVMGSLEESLPLLEEEANGILRACGKSHKAQVTLEKEAFPERTGDGFRLPAGVYQTLRVTIGEGKGHNWWGVLFPQHWEAEPVSASLTEGEQPKIRFFFLEKLGQIQNWMRGR